MSIYSIENIEVILRQLLRKEGMASVGPEEFTSQREQIKSHKDSKKEHAKQLRLLRRQLSTLDGDESLNIKEKVGKKKELSRKVEDLEEKIREENATIDGDEKKWNETIEKYAKDLLKGLRSKKLKPIIDDFLLFDKMTFKTGDLDSKVIEQLIKEDIAKHYKRKPADRNRIIEQLKGLLGNKLPKIIIRADIKSFFESVPMGPLIKKLEDDGYISATTLAYLRQIRKAVKDKGLDGVPRGLAFSSYLTEIYLQRVDDNIRSLPNLYFYQRYVDDMIMLFSVDKHMHWPYFSQVGMVHWNEVSEICENEYLSLHVDGKKQKIFYSGKTNKNEFDYLGYKFIIDEGKLTVRLSSDRLEKYKRRISAIVSHYNKTARDNESMANLSDSMPEGGHRRKRQQPLRRLFGQLSALTGNGMLKGPKSNILTGVYYSNQHLTSLEDLMDLDAYLSKRIRYILRIPENLFRYTDYSDPEEAKRRIKGMMIEKWSFVDGFKNRRFCNNSSYFNRLKQIKRLSR